MEDKVNRPPERPPATGDCGVQPPSMPAGHRACRLEAAPLQGLFNRITSGTGPQELALEFLLLGGRTCGRPTSSSLMPSLLSTLTPIGEPDPVGDEGHVDPARSGSRGQKFSAEWLGSSTNRILTFRPSRPGGRGWTTFSVAYAPASALRAGRTRCSSPPPADDPCSPCPLWSGFARCLGLEAKSRASFERLDQLRRVS